MRYSLLLPLVFLSLAGCVVAGPPERSAYVERSHPAYVEQQQPMVVVRP
jgi:hypothetical protein